MTQSCPIQLSGNSSEQAGAELDQAQVKLDVVVKVLFEFEVVFLVQVVVHYFSGRQVGGCV